MATVQSFIWRILISLMKLAHDNNREVITEVYEQNQVMWCFLCILN